MWGRSEGKKRAGKEGEEDESRPERMGGQGERGRERERERGVGEEQIRV